MAGLVRCGGTRMRTAAIGTHPSPLHHPAQRLLDELEGDKYTYPLMRMTRGESSEAAMLRHATAENATQREFQKNFSTFTRKIRFCSTGYTLKGVPFKPH